MPVQVTVGGADARAAFVTLSSEGTLPTVLPLVGGKADAVMPWLVLRAPVRAAKWSLADASGHPVAEGTIDAPLKPLDDDEGLVAYTGGDAREAVLAAAELLPGRRVVPVQLDLTRPLLAPAAAYQATDLLLLDPTAAPASSSRRWRCSWPAARPSRCDRPRPTPATTGPGGGRGRGGCWGIRPVGPRSPVELQAYDPTYGWEHGWPADVRRRAVLLAALAGIALLGLSLWRSRYAAWAGAALSLAAAVAVTVWAGRQSPVLSAGGALVVWDGSVAQRDYWAYRTTLRDTETCVPWHAEPSAPAPPAPPPTSPERRVLSVPVFAGREHVRQVGMKLLCRTDGQPDRFVARLEHRRDAGCPEPVGEPGPTDGTAGEPGDAGHAGRRAGVAGKRVGGHVAALGPGLPPLPRALSGSVVEGDDDGAGGGAGAAGAMANDLYRK